MTGATTKRTLAAVSSVPTMPNNICNNNRVAALCIVIGLASLASFADGFSIGGGGSSLPWDNSAVRTSSQHSFTALSSTPGDGALSASTAVIPPRTKKHQSRTKSRRKLRRKSGKSASLETNSYGKPLPKSDVGHHVAKQYITGPGSVLRDKASRRDRMETQNNIVKEDSSHKEQMQYLRMLDRHPALVLNADYQPMSLLPLSLWCWQDAVKAIFQGKVTVVDTYPDVFIRAVNIDMPLPSVIALNEYVPKKDQTPAFTRRNVFLRDGYRCQYCNQYFRTNDLTLDHFVPRSLGGPLNWQNAVSSCRKCNGRKGSIHPKKLRSIGMRVLQEPRVPTQWELASMAGKMVPKKVHATWQPYLGAIATEPENTDPKPRATAYTKKKGGKTRGVGWNEEGGIDDLFGDLRP